MTHIRLALLLLILQISHIGCTHRREAPAVPADFKYPIAGENVAIADPLVARRFSGRVLDPNGDAVKQALVEVTSADWSERVSATFTDDRGFFSFSKLGLGQYPIRVTKPGFAPLLAKIKVSKTGPASVDLSLHLAM